MLREHSKELGQLSKLTDVSLIGVGFYLIVILYRYKGTIHTDIPLNYILIFLSYVLSWILSSNFNGVYESRRLMTLFNEISVMVKAHFLASALSLISLNLYDPMLISNRFIYYFITTSALLTLFVHLVVRTAIQHLRKAGRNTKYCLILGNGPAAEMTLNRVQDNPSLGYQMIGYISPKPTSLKTSYLGDYNQLETVLKSQVVDLVIVTASITEDRVQECVQLMETMGKQAVLYIDEIFHQISKYRPVDFGGLSMVALDAHPRKTWEELMKIAFDLVVSSVGLVVISPLLLTIAIIIKTTSKGPVFFVQERVGLNGRLFNMYKFRSMVQDAEAQKEKLTALNEMHGPVFKIKNDPRVTPFGRFLRRTSLDELPQLWNVLRQEMSLVGPRPPLPSEVNYYDPKHRKRLSVRPGITCIWQISGRNDVDFDQWMDMDTAYVDQWSFWLDLTILAKTVPVVLLRKGAS